MEYSDKEFCIEVYSDYALFTRPEMKVERVSYDVITPSAVRAIFEAIFWKPAIRWQPTRIEVLKPIRWGSIRRNEIGSTMSPRSPHLFIEDKRQQRASLLLRDVAYRLTARMVYLPPSKRQGETMTEHPLDDENPAKYQSIFERRASKGQCFTQPYLGCREFTCQYNYIADPQTTSLTPPIDETRDLGIMLYDMDFEANKTAPPAMFFRAKLDHGVITVPDKNSKEILR